MVTRAEEAYQCSICGIKVKVVEGGAGTLVCCGEAMAKLDKE